MAATDPSTVGRSPMPAGHPLDLLRPGRRITGMSAVLLPLVNGTEIDWPAFDAHLLRTAEAGLTPAINMDTGYVHLLDEATQDAILRRTREVLAGGAFVAGAFVADQPGAAWNPSAYLRRCERIGAEGGMPVIFPSYGLTELPSAALLEAYRHLGRHCERFLAFELGKMFAPFGAIYDLATYEALLSIPQCVGAKHSSLSREAEWQRLRIRDRVRPEFLVLTGNDLAIDMVMYGSDYLLGLSTMAPDLFAARDAFWARQDPGFYELNDALQYLGAFTFRPPVPAYKHSAAQFLQLRGWCTSSATHAGSPERPASDVEVLRTMAERLGVVVK